MKIIFICNQNKNRSKTAEELFRQRCETKSAGLYTQNPVTAKELSWADVVIVMEEEQRRELAKRFPKLYLQKRILSFDVPDMYLYNDQRLTEILEKRWEEYREILA